MRYVTAKDLQDTLINMVGGNADNESVTDIRQAIRQALRMVSAEHAWPYYHDYMHLNTNEVYDTGTITYTASTRTVTLSGGTFPTWAASGVLIIDTYHCRVQTRTNGTTLVIRSDDAPVDDFTGDFTIYQYQYSLTSDYNIYKFGKIQVDQSNWLEYVPPSIFETDIRRQALTTGGRPRWFTISRSIALTGRNVISLWPYPTTELRLRMGYIRHPMDILTWDYQTGQVATTASSASITGTGTVFASRHVGSLLRTYSDRLNAPTSRDGLYPPVDESVISAYTSATSITTTDEMTTTASDVAYVISDLLDVDNTIMLELITYAARKELASLRRVDPKLQAMYEADYQQKLYLAKTQSLSDNSVKMAGAFRRSQAGWPGLWDSYYTLS